MIEEKYPEINPIPIIGYYCDNCSEMNYERLVQFDEENIELDEIDEEDFYADDDDDEEEWIPQMECIKKNPTCVKCGQKHSVPNQM